MGLWLRHSFPTKDNVNTAQWIIVYWGDVCLSCCDVHPFPFPRKQPSLCLSWCQSFTYTISSIAAVIRTSLQTINYVGENDESIKLTPGWSVVIFWERNPSSHELFTSHFKTFWLVPIHCVTPNQITISLQIEMIRGDIWVAITHWLLTMIVLSAVCYWRYHTPYKTDILNFIIFFSRAIILYNTKYYYW